MKRNEGLSLIELIVVIAISTVMIGVIGISVTTISRQKVSNAVEDVKVLFQTAQTIAMSKDNCHITIDRNSDGDTVFTLYSSANNTELNRITVSKKVKIYIVEASGAESSIESPSTKVVRIYYDRVSGAFSEMYKGGNATLGSGGSGKGSSVNITGIKFSNGDDANAITLRLTKLTGKVAY